MRVSDVIKMVPIVLRSKVVPATYIELVKSLLLPMNVLPDGQWKQHEMFLGLRQRKDGPEEVGRAKKARGITGQRELWNGKLWHEESQELVSVICNIRLMANAEDAKSYAPKIAATDRPNPLFTISTELLSTVAPRDRPMGLAPMDVVSEHRYRVTNRSDRPGMHIDRCVRTTVERAVFSYTFSSVEEPWPWDVLSPIIVGERARVTAVLREQASA